MYLFSPPFVEVGGVLLEITSVLSQQGGVRQSADRLETKCANEK